MQVVIYGMSSKSMSTNLNPITSRDGEGNISLIEYYVYKTFVGINGDC